MLSSSKLGLALSFAGATLLLAGTADAATVVLSGSVASAVDDLVVDNVTYDVTFSNSPDATFVGNAAGAADAVSALDDALNGTAAAFVVEPGVGSINQFIVQDGSAGTGLWTSSFFVAHNWRALGNTTGDGSTADFTEVAATPLPPALSLFAAGLAVLGALGWRRNQKRSALTVA